MRVLNLILLVALPIIIGQGPEAAESPEVAKVLNLKPKVPEHVIGDLRAVINSFNKKKKLPDSYLKKGQVCALGWKSLKECGVSKEECNLPELRKGWGRFLIGGDSYVNTLDWPRKKYFEADLGDYGAKKCRNAYRIVYSKDLKDIYFTRDHYQTFIKLR